MTSAAHSAIETSMVKALMRKDAQLIRASLPGFVLTGLGAVAMLVLPGKAPFYIGCLLLVSVLLVLGVHLPVTLVLGERRNKTLSFVMSLPITPTDYTVSKLAGCLGHYLAVWLALSGATLAAVWTLGTRPHGLIPLLAIVLLGCAANAVLVLAAAIVRDSLERTVRAVIFWDVVLQAAVYFAVTNGEIAATMMGPEVQWSPSALVFLGVESLLIVFGLAAAWRGQARKSQLV